MEVEIKKLSGTYYDEDLKNTLLIEAEKLKKLAQEEIEKLKKEGKAKLAEGLEAAEKRILDIDAQLRALNPKTEVGKAVLSVLEGLLKKAETALEAEIKKLSGSYYDIKDDLKTQVDNLKKQAQEAIAKLLAQGKGALATEIKSLETHLVDLEAQLEKLNPTTEVGKALLKGLETLVKAAEGKLEEEIKKLSGSFYDIKDDLKTQVDNLKKQAQEAIAKLLAQGKGALATEIKSLETHLVDLEAQLEKLNPTTEVGKALLKGLETLVKAAEGKLEEEIKKLSGSF